MTGILIFLVMGIQTLSGVTGIQVDWYTNTLVYRWTGILVFMKHFHFVINLFCSYTWVITFFVYNFAVIIITLFI